MSASGSGICVGSKSYSKLRVNLVVVDVGCHIRNLTVELGSRGRVGDGVRVGLHCSGEGGCGAD
jgi:hypothetical protein